MHLQLKWQHQFQFAGYYAAIERGYYRDAGLEVILLEAEPGQDPMDEVLEGRAEFGVGTSELLLMRAKGHPVVVLGVIYQHSPLVLAARRDSGIDHLYDLAGKRVMIEPHSAELWAYLRREQVPWDTFEKLDHSFDIKDLIEGRVDAFSAYSTDEIYDLRRENIPHLLFSPRAGGIDFYGDNFFTTEAQISRYPRRVAAFREATLRGWRYAFAHPEEIVDLILEKYSQRKTRDHLLFEAQQSIHLSQPELIEVGYMYRGRWQHIAELFATLGMLEGDWQPETFLYSEESSPNLRKYYLGIMLSLLLALLAGALAWWFRLLHLRAQQSELRHRRIFDHAPAAFILSDHQFRIRHWNREAERIFGWKEEEVMGKHIIDLLVPDADKEAVVDVLSRVQNERKPITWVNQNFRRDGSRIWCRWENVFDNASQRSNRGVLSIALDITKVHENEVQLRSALTELQAANENLIYQTEALDEARKDAEAASRAKNEFMAMISHEIRTPMNAIIGYAELLQQRIHDESLHEMTHVIQSSSHDLLRIIDDLLNFSKIEAGALELKRKVMDPVALVKDVHSLLSPLAEPRGLQFTWEKRGDVPTGIQTDEGCLRQILINLVGNGIKFTDLGGVLLRVEYRVSNEFEDGELLFSVLDTGIGMDPDKVDKLFEPFCQADSTTTRRHGGTGLGLSIVKKLVELLGGEIQVNTQLGEGTTITVRIPVQHMQPEVKDLI